MLRSQWLRGLFGLAGSRNDRCLATRGHRLVRLVLEQLEDRITPTGPTLTTLVSFPVPSGPNGLIVDGSGNLYGVAQNGAFGDSGSVFELAKGSNTTTTLASFNGNSSGDGPSARLIMDSEGNLYGTTAVGGASGDGTVFELTHQSSLTTLASFSGGSGGANPYAGVAIDSNGNLYGTTLNGGSNNEGTVFELAKGSNTITTVASFNGNDGSYPSTGLVMDSNGNLYGTTGVEGDGTVFEVAKGSNTITTLASFNGSNGTYPSSLILESSGNLYGITTGGGAYNDGSIFELAKGSNTITTLASFNIPGGAYGSVVSASLWYVGLVMDAAGNLYGTTSYGGANGNGTVFELPQGSSTITTLASFNVSNGSTPDGSMVMDGSGNLYGTTMAGGMYGAYTTGGTVFELPGVGSVATAPAITAQPTNQTVTAGSNVSFTASASGVPAPTVQWQVSIDDGATWTNINGATSTTLTLNNATPAMNGHEYQAVFTNSAGIATTSAAILSVQYAPIVSTNPSDETVTAGQNASFTVAANANPTPTVQWQVSTDGGQTWGNISGVSSTTLTLTAVTASMNSSEYHAVFANGLGSITTSAATLTVQYTPVVTTNPGNQTVMAGSTATFTASGGGNPAPTVQWQVSSDSGATWANIGGATSTTLTLTNVLISMNNDEYRAVFTNSIGSNATTAALLTVQTAPPTITSGKSAAFTVGQGGSFIVTATGSPTPTLMESGTLPSGVGFTASGNSMATLTGVPAAGTQGTYQFTITAHNGVGSDFTQNFTLTVIPAPAPPPAPPSPPPSPPQPPVLNVPPLLAALNSLLGEIETVNADGSETVTDTLFGIPLVVATYDSKGGLTSVILFGINITFLFV